ncbi:HIT family protein [Blattabacterium cuenoti]|uniref:HIT family protein n=1 Tax=Blattabacterium cuenoti TaxID=1653831 RepID=UPI00163CD15D|nr:HIT family protein [Blattabacterium cuenoti]
MKNNIFQQIITNEIHSYKIAENADFIAFLDIYPMKIGHTLVIPKKKNIGNIFYISEKDYLSIMIFSRKIALGIEHEIPCNRVGLFIMGFEIPNHVHIHLIPMDQESDGDFSKKRISLSNHQFHLISKRLKKYINKIL